MLGSLLKRAYGVKIEEADSIDWSKANAIERNGHAFRTIKAYEEWLLRDGGEEGARAVAILRLIGLFDRSAVIEPPYLVQNE